MPQKTHRARSARRRTHNSTLAEQVRYQFDNFMAQGTVALISGLALVSFVFILLMAALVSLLGVAPEGSEPLTLAEALWGVLMRTLDSGTVGGDNGWTFRLTMLFVTFGGIFVVSTLIGLLSSGIEAKLEDLRKGRSRVIESDHIVILGWSLQIFTLISELVLANANQSDTCIVVLSEQDKVEMETALADMLGKLSRTRLVCRTGSPSHMADLGMVSVQTARSIIILHPSQEGGDATLVKTLLAITNIPRSHPQPYHLVAQVQSEKTLDVLRLVAHDEIEPLLIHDLISRIVVQTCRQSGLSTVYMDLLNFSGSEIYFREEPTLQDKTYGQALLAYNNSAVIGLQDSQGTIHLNAPGDRILQPGDRLIMVSEDDDTMDLSLGAAPIDTGAIHLTDPEPAIAEHTLILGWNNRLSHILTLLDQYVAPQSTITIVADPAITPPGFTADGVHGQDYLTHQTLQYYPGDPTDRDVLDRLDLGKYDHALVLCNFDLDPQQADAQTLITLLHLRDICNQKQHDLQIVTEILDVRNQALAQVARPDDFVISEQIISLMMAQVAEQKSLNAVLTELFSPEGSEVYLKPVGQYVTLERPVNFYTVVEAAQRRGESAIGYRRRAMAQSMAQDYGVVLNPPKDQPIQFREQDVIIVVSQS
jgi:voltage-gated potassium channel Kch